MTTLEAFDRARDRLAASGFDSDVQTRIALFLSAVKSLHAALLVPAELTPGATIAYPFMHGQYCRENEFTTLLARVTRWSANPMLYWEAASLTAPLWTEWFRIQGVTGTLLDPRAGYRALAFGHALLARVRLAAVIPEDADPLDPFIAAIARIEQENGRMIQAQIRLLKSAPAAIPPEERERIVEEEQAIVDDAFDKFIAWLADGRADPNT